MNSAQYHKDSSRPIIITINIQNDVKMRHRKIASVKFTTIDSQKDRSMTQKVLKLLDSNMDYIRSGEDHRSTGFK